MRCFVRKLVAIQKATSLSPPYTTPPPYLQKTQTVSFRKPLLRPTEYHQERFAWTGRYGNHLVSGLDYTVGTIEHRIRAPVASGGSSKMCEAERCPDGTQHHPY